MSTTINPTQWVPPSNDGEYSLGSADNIVDASGNTVADASSNLVASTDTTFTLIPATTWSTNDGS